MNKRQWEVFLAGVLIIYFVARALFFALNIKPHIPPDEITHVGIIRLYAKAPLFIQDSPESYQFGPVTHVPYLYHLLLGKILKLVPSQLEPHRVLRLLNVGLGLLTVLFSYRLACLLTENSLVRILFLLMLTNTLMFTFLAGSVNYDNLVNLLSVLSIYWLFCFFKTERVSHLLGFLIFLLAGALTKVSFLPLALILFGFYLYERRPRLAADGKSLSRYLFSPRLTSVALAGCLGVLLVANLTLYGANVLRFGRLIPSCDQILTPKQCMEYRIYARNQILRNFRKGRLSFREAIEAARRINHPGDRASTIYLLRQQERDRLRPKSLLDPFSYFFSFWTQQMLATSFGILGHLSLFKRARDLLPYNIILLAAFLLWVRNFRLDEASKPWNYLAAVFGLYLLVVAGYFNYRHYLETNILVMGVQGRYIFPVLAPAYLLAAHHLLSPWRKPLQVALVLLVGLVFVSGDFPYFYRKATGQWFASYSNRTSLAPTLRRPAPRGPQPLRPAGQGALGLPGQKIAGRRPKAKDRCYNCGAKDQSRRQTSLYGNARQGSNQSKHNLLKAQISRGQAHHPG
jgi:hypothetical protein